MKYLFTVLCFFYLSSLSFAQNYEIDDISELKNDLSARINKRSAPNGSFCALIRVNIPSVNGIHFKSIVGEPECLPGEYNVFVPEKTPILEFVANGTDYVIDFSKHNIVIEGQKCYRVVLSKKSLNTQKNTKTTITANYDNVVVLLDGIPVGQTPLVLDNVSLGKHTLSVPNTLGVTMKDKIVNFKQNNMFDLRLYKEKRKHVNVEMATPGGDTAGWYEVFGTNVKEQNGKVGIVDYAGNIVVPYEFDYIYPSMQNGYYIVYQNHKAGLYEPGTGLIVPCIYDGFLTNRSNTHDKYILVEKDGKYGLLSPLGKLVVPIEYAAGWDQPQCDNDAIRMPKTIRGRTYWGLFDYNGRQIASPKYEDLYPFVNGYALFSRQSNGNVFQGIVDINGNEKIIPSVYRRRGLIVSSGLFAIRDKNSGKLGYMDTQLNVVIPTIYDPFYDDQAPDFNQGIVQLKLDGDDIILNDKGEVVVSAKSKGYKKPYIVYQRGGNGRFLWFNPKDDGINENTFIIVENEEGKCGLLNVQGKVIVPCEYLYNDNGYNIQWFFDEGQNFFVLKNEKSIEVMNEQKQVLFSLPTTLSVVDMRDGFVMIKDENTNSYGYLNRKGEILANCIYGYNSEEAYQIDYNDGYDMDRLIEDKPISEGMALLAIGDRFGFIDNKGNVKVPLKYTAVTPFENGIAYVRDQDGIWKKIFKKDL